MWALFTPLIIAATITAIVLTIKLRILQYRVLTLQLAALQRPSSFAQEVSPSIKIVQRRGQL